MNIREKIVGFFDGWWICPQCGEKIVGLSSERVTKHVREHGVSELGALLVEDLVRELGGACFYPTRVQEEVADFFNVKPHRVRPYEKKEA